MYVARVAFRAMHPRGTLLGKFHDWTPRVRKKCCVYFDSPHLRTEIRGITPDWVGRGVIFSGWGVVKRGLAIRIFQSSFKWYFRMCFRLVCYWKCLSLINYAEYRFSLNVLVVTNSIYLFKISYWIFRYTNAKGKENLLSRVDDNGKSYLNNERYVQLVRLESIFRLKLICILSHFVRFDYAANPFHPKVTRRNEINISVLISLEIFINYGKAI